MKSASLPSEDVLVVGLGMMTSAGLSAPETAASVKASTMRFSESSFLDRLAEPFTLAEIPEDALPDLSQGLAAIGDISSRSRRLLRIATGPLTECLKPLAVRPNPLPLFLAIPDMPQGQAAAPADFLGLLSKQTEGAFDEGGSRVITQGRAGGLVALGEAFEYLRTGRGRFVLAGGIDTLRDPDLLGRLDLEGRVKSSANLDGFIPGEGAAFVLLAGRKAAGEAGLTPMARLWPVRSGFEPGHLYSQEIYRGDGLAAAFQEFFSETGFTEAARDVYSSMNGESHWIKEWGVAFLRSHDSFAADSSVHHPADCYGDTGAASGPLMVGLAAIGLKQGYRRSPSLVFASSDRGERAVTALSA